MHIDCGEGQGVEAGDELTGKFVNRRALVVEVVVCFGPLAAFLLIGVATLPFSLRGIVSALLTSSESGYTDAPLWMLIAPIIAVLGGGCGLAALFIVVQGLCAEPPKLAYSSSVVLVMMTVGLMTLFAIGGFGSTDTQYAVSRLLFFWLPLLSSVHIMYLARGLLFGRRKSEPPPFN